MPVIAVAPNDYLLEKLKSNLKEVEARGGKLIVFNDHTSGIQMDWISRALRCQNR